MLDVAELESAIWSIADGRGTTDDSARLEADRRASLAVLDGLIVDIDRDLASARRLTGDEREQVVGDLAETLDNLRDIASGLRPNKNGTPRPHDRAAVAVSPQATANEPEAPDEPIEPGEVELHASWSSGQVVVWAGGRGVEPEDHDGLSARLESIGGPPLGWEVHAGVPLPGGQRAASLAIPMKDALGWLVAVGGGHGRTGVGAAVLWLGHVALEGVRLAASGSIVPALQVGNRTRNGIVDAQVRWRPALIDRPAISALTDVMPGTVAALGGGDASAITSSVIASVVETIAIESVERMELPAPPPVVNSPRDVRDALIARMDGTPFAAPAAHVRGVASTLEQWTRPVTSRSVARLVVQLDAPEPGGVWLLSVSVPSPAGRLTPINAALRGTRPSDPVAAEWTRLGRLFPTIHRAAANRRGHVALSQEEAWDFMTAAGPTLGAAGFDVRVPTLSRRKATPTLRLSTEASASTVVGANQLSNVVWSVVFDDDVELSAADVARLARQARPLVQSPRGWVEIDRVDLDAAAAALAERAATKQLTGAEILRASIGLDGTGLRGGVDVRGRSWATDLLRRAAEAPTAPISRPPGFVGELRTYQAEALTWLGFLDAAELGGCLALDMGLGKTPTVLAHVARVAHEGPSTTTLVIAPAAVVGNWAAEAARFVPGLRVVVHHGASRSADERLDAEIAEAEMVITTYATAVRDIDALAGVEWDRIVLDEAQAIKNPASDTAQQLRRIPARSRLALTGTPIENGLADLWAILDFTNPGLVGPRAAFVAQLSGDGETALRALNGILLFRRTKSEPEVAAELPDKIDEVDHCTMTAEQIGLYQAVLDELVVATDADAGERKKGAILAAITALKQICDHPAAYRDDGGSLIGRSGKLSRLEEIVESVFAAGERILVFTHFAQWGRRLAAHLSDVTGSPISCYDGGLARSRRDALVTEFQEGKGPGALVLSLKAGGTGLNLTAANHVVLYDRWWNPAVEDQARDRAWRIGQQRTVISHRLVCPGTVDERVEEVVAGKRHIAQLVLPKSSSIADLSSEQLGIALGLRPDELLRDDQ
jgi:superfamily II DNA or RNA helicase